MGGALTWLLTGSHWTDQLGTPGILHQLGSHLEYSLIALLVAAALALPAGALIGHTERGRGVITVANGLRSLPTTGLLILAYVVISPHIGGRGQAPYLVPTEIVLVLLAVPPVLASTYAGVSTVDPAVRDASRGMGMTGAQVLVRVELPTALPLVLSGLRSATLQVIATATVAAYVGLGGLGRYLYDGLASHDFAQVSGGAVLVAALALAADGVLALVERLVVSRGVSGRFRTRSTAPADARSAALAEAPPA